MHTHLSLAELNAALGIVDLSDPAAGHALSTLLANVTGALASRWGVPVAEHRHNPLVATRDNYDRLGYAPTDITRDARYSRHVSPTVMLRSHTSAGVPAVLDALRPELGRYDTLHVLPGLVYRRDAVDRTHVGTPHQVDLWRLRSRAPLGVPELMDMLGTVVEAVLPGARWRAVPTTHSYTTAGVQLDVQVRGEWLELAEAGLVAASVLRASGLDPRRWGGLALGLGLDRALMLRKGIDDIRLLRSADPRVAAQMADLAPYRPVSAMPPVRRDLSLVCADDVDAEVLGDAARSALGADAEVLAGLEVLAVTPAAELPAAAAARLGLVPGSGRANVLVRLTLQSLERTLTATEANRLRNRVYLALHDGPARELIAV
ncbi:PheS-related mystery ligase SrmL [Specibacter sp. RAF43]|uniref:PheS-related mystery ligase SrmL n=1 Tax=Specibacter sp. RAF43 TaxID=3233057 RepID=UPI003F9CE4AB